MGLAHSSSSSEAGLVNSNQDDEGAWEFGILGGPARTEGSVVRIRSCEWFCKQPFARKGRASKSEVPAAVLTE